MEIPIWQVDAFASEAFKGNPAAVCVLDAPKPAPWMQSVGAEMNLPMTAFVVPRAGSGDAAGEYDLRWFTADREMPLCGHATLASAHVLWETGRLAETRPAQFHTLGGLLTCRRAGRRIEMDFPALPSRPSELPAAIADALGVTPRKVVRQQRPDGAGGNFLLELDSEAAVRKLKPDFELLRKAADVGVIITARGETSGFDFVSRYFACYAGIDEDFVTGSAHCLLGPYWASVLGKTEMAAYQASSRGGAISVRVEGERVCLGGEAVTILRGSLLC